jgi:hypothetical protein
VWLCLPEAAFSLLAALSPNSVPGSWVLASSLFFAEANDVGVDRHAKLIIKGSTGSVTVLQDGVRYKNDELFLPVTP